MDKTKKKTVKRIALSAAALAVAAGLAILPFAINKSGGTESKASIRSARVETGSIQKTISGTGTLTDQDAMEITFPEGVKQTGYLVSNGEQVKKGDAVAKVDRASVMETISSVRESMDDLAKEITSSSSGEEQSIYAPASCRVKAIYAKKGDPVRDVIEEYGALAVLSLDGYMAARLPAGELSARQEVTVVLANGTAVDGKVDAVTDGEAIVIISDRYGDIGETVEIRTTDGSSVGSAELYVRSAWKAMASAGTVKTVYVRSNENCNKDGTLIIIDGTDKNLTDILLDQYRDYEDTMAKLFQLYQDGGAVAPCDGFVSGVDESLVTQISAKDGFSVVLLANAPGDDPDGAYRNRIGMVTAVNEDGTITAKMQGWDTQIDDYQNPGYVYTAADSMTVEVTLSPPPAYSWSGDQWARVGIQPGDVFIFGYGDVLAWMIYAGHNEIEVPGPGPDDPSNPDNPDNPVRPDMPGQNNGGGFPGGSGMPDGAQDAPEPEPTETLILSVTPMEKVTVSITVDELDILSVHVGQAVTVTLDALAGQAFDGVITEVNTEASNDGGHSKYSAVVELERTEKMLGGMNASALIVVEERDNVLLIPSEALIENKGQPAVYTSYDSKTEEFGTPVTVELGLSDGTSVQILSGLGEGDEIWYETYDKLEIEGLS